MALSRLPSTERNLKKNSRVADEYQATIQAYVEKEYLRKVPYRWDSIHKVPHILKEPMK